MPLGKSDRLRSGVRLVLPRSARRGLRDIAARRVRRARWPELAAAVADLREIAPHDPPLALLERARYGWGDPDSAPAGLMLEALRRFRGHGGDGVECGSGLSTIVLGVFAEALDRRWWALEQDPRWATRVRGAADALELAAPAVLDAPLVPYDGFDWYAVPDQLPPAIDFVLCDGPPANGEAIRRRRFGLVPVLGDRFSPTIEILLDDASRPGEREILELWKRDGFHWTTGTATREFAVVSRAT
jgi:hypothetical protein